MEPRSSFKRRSDTDFEKCLICQRDRQSKILHGGAQGIKTIKECAQERLKRKDSVNRDCIDRILSYDGDRLIWHKECYSTFTSKTLISRLRDTDTVLVNQPTSSDTVKNLRSKSSTIDWGLCLFCQQCSRKTVHSVESFHTSNKIMQSVPYDHKLKVALGGVSDLMAAEGKYHLACYSKFLRDSAEFKEHAQKTGVAMGWLCTELRQSASKGHVLDLEEVWDYYQRLCEESGEKVPNSFLSRRSSFKDKLKETVEKYYEFHILQKSEEHEKCTVLVPKDFSHIPIAQLLASRDDECTIPVYRPGDDIFLSMIHVALKLRSDILSHPSYQGFHVTKEAAIACVPESIYMFLKVLYGGQEILEPRPDSEDFEPEDITHDRIVSVGQDLVFGVSNGKKWTPKHVGLGSTLHQSTRSKALVQLFHRAGHTISYDGVMRVDTALAEATLESLNRENGAIVPRNLVPQRFIHFSTDNIDILDSSLDGKDTFHATQVTAWQRGPQPDTNALANLQPCQKKLIVPDALTTTIPPDKFVGSPEPRFKNAVQLEWFTGTEETDPHIAIAKGKDLAFLMKRLTENPRPGLSEFNQIHSEHNPPVTTIGYMPIILNPAHEYETLNTVIIRCKYIAESLGQQHVVITADEALYSRLMELKWSQDGYTFLIPRLGGLHTAMNFMKSIGQHLQSAGLIELWTESGLLGTKTAERVLAGKDYEKGMRAHKITFQTMWELLLPQLMEFLGHTYKDLKQKIEQATGDDDDMKLTQVLVTEEFKVALECFVEEKKEDPNFVLWYTYLEMVSILLLFTRAQRDGLWDLHLSAFKMMLPYFHHYSHRRNTERIQGREFCGESRRDKVQPG